MAAKKGYISAEELVPKSTNKVDEDLLRFETMSSRSFSLE
jgi:hypothetical protein